MHGHAPPLKEDLLIEGNLVVAVTADIVLSPKVKVDKDLRRDSLQYKQRKKGGEEEEEEYK